MALETLSSQRTIHAPAAAIFDLLADPGRHSEIDGSGSVLGSADKGTRLALGSTFGMSMKKGFSYSTKNVVVEFDEGRLIAWQTVPVFRWLGGLVGGRIWRYELEPAGDDVTVVRETWDIRQEKIRVAVVPMAKGTQKAMDATLARIEEIVTA